MSVKADVMQAVRPQWETARLIWSNVNRWGFTSVRHALTKLAEDGKIEAKYAPHPNGTVILYRKGKR